MVSKPAWLTYAVVAAVALVLVLPSAQGLAQSPTPTTQPAAKWIGRIVSVTQDLSLRGSVLRVSVDGIKGLPVRVSSGGWSVVALTGSKPEFGPYVARVCAYPPRPGRHRAAGFGHVAVPERGHDELHHRAVHEGVQPVEPATPSPTSTPWTIVVPTLGPDEATATPWVFVTTPTPAPTATPLPLSTIPSVEVVPTVERIVPTAVPTLPPTAAPLPSPTFTPAANRRTQP